MLRKLTPCTCLLQAVSMAQLQGHLMLYRRDPVEAVRRVDALNP